VTSPNLYEPDLNPTYQDFAYHYGIAVVPARVRKPRDKAKVEVGVQVVERWILARLRDRTFFSLTELNQAIAELLAEPITSVPCYKVIEIGLCLRQGLITTPGCIPINLGVRSVVVEVLQIGLPECPQRQTLCWQHRKWCEERSDVHR